MQGLHSKLVVEDLVHVHREEEVSLMPDMSAKTRGFHTQLDEGPETP